MARRVTEKQMDVLRFTHDYTNNNGSAPVVKEIAEGLGISMSLARDRIWYLFGHGCLARPEPGQRIHSITLTEKGILACESKERPYRYKNVVPIYNHQKYMYCR